MIIHPTGQFDNQPRPYQHLRAKPLAAAMGAEIQGVQVAEINEAAFGEIEDALFRHKMIYFRDQDLSHGDLEKFINAWLRAGCPRHRNKDIQMDDE